MLSPLGNRVLIRRTKYSTKSSGGILIPDSFNDQPLRGHVVSAGPGKRMSNGKTVPISVKEGDLVVFTKDHIENIKVDDEDFIIMNEDNIVAILEEE